jgi:DME family drug/metabolite transporter
MKPLSDLRGMLLVALAATLWGSIGFVVALLSGGVMASDPLLIACGRVALAAPVLWVWHRVRSGRWGITLSTAHVLVLVAAGVVFALYHVTYFAAIPRVGLTYAVLLNICTAPLFAMIIARVTLAERIQRAQILAVALAVLGCVVLVGGVPVSAHIDGVGVALAVAAGLCYAALTVLTRRVAPEADPVTIQAVIMSVAAGVLLLGLTQAPVVLTGLPWLSLLYLALVPTVLSYVLYTRGLSVVGATTAASLTLLEPLVSTMLAVGILGERMSAVSWVGAVVLGMSLLLVARRT